IEQVHLELIRMGLFAGGAEALLLSQTELFLVPLEFSGQFGNLCILLGDFGCILFRCGWGIRSIFHTLNFDKTVYFPATRPTKMKNPLNDGLSGDLFVSLPLLKGKSIQEPAKFAKRNDNRRVARPRPLKGSAFQAAVQQPEAIMFPI
ncbi:hypothetical protein BSK60_32045, partial [Paenibacillus odorifer]